MKIRNTKSEMRNKSKARNQQLGQDGSGFEFNASSLSHFLCLKFLVCESGDAVC
jgi:hypothetical protein